MSHRLREEFLKLLREDEEFRYAVLGLLGLDEVLRVIKSLQEQVLKLQEQVSEHTRVIRMLQEQMSEHSRAIRSLQEQVSENTKAIKSLQEQVRSLQEQVAEHSKAIKSLQEQVRNLQEQVIELQREVREHSKAIKSLQEQVLKLQEEVKRHGEILEGHSKVLEAHSRAIEKLASKIDALGTRWGIVTEETFREGIKYLIEDLIKLYKVDKWIHYDKEGFVYGYPSWIEVDVLIKDTEHILVEFKAHADKSDIGELYKIGLLYEKVNGIKPKLLMVASTIRKRAKELADKAGIECRGTILEY